MATGPYIQAVETQLRWLHILEQEGTAEDYSSGMFALNSERSNTMKGPKLTSENLIYNQRRLKTLTGIADTFFMNKRFCELADLAASNTPLDLRFDIQWLQSKVGFLVRESRVNICPSIPDLFDVFTWSKWEENVDINWLTTDYTKRHMTAWECRLCNGESIAEAIERCNKIQRLGKEDDLREIFKLTYSMFHLMAEKVALTIHQKVDRSARRRAQKAGQVAPEIIKVITLRRMEEARKREAPQNVEWHWQWEVRGHWRNQFYPSENTHKPVFVEAYIKGPTDKPFKSPGLKLFAAVR